MAEQRTRLERLLTWRLWERLLEIEFLDRSIALAGKAFVSFFPMVIVVAAFLPERARQSILTALTFRLGLRGDTLDLAREAFSTSDELKDATSWVGLLLMIFFAASFVTALQRTYLRAWRRPPTSGVGRYVRGAVVVALVLAGMAALGMAGSAAEGGLGVGVVALVGFVVTTVVWWFAAWYLLLGHVRARALLSTGLVTSVTTGLYAISAAVWMPGVVEENEAQFGFFGIGLSLVTWFSGAAICILVGACIGPVLAEDAGWLGSRIRGTHDSILVAGAPPPLPPPARELTLRDAFESTDDS
jgi:membrane protein